MRRGLLYAGTENDLYVSFNDGELWQPLQNNLPHAPVYWLVIQEHFNDLVVATSGRGFWILDDISPLRQLGPEMTGRDADLLPPRPAYRFCGGEAPFAPYHDPVAGFNPPYGADLHYWLKTAGQDTTKDSVTITITGAGGRTVRTLKGPMKAGLGGSEPGIREQMELAEDLYQDINGVVEAINRAELVRGQLATLKAFLAADTATADVRARADTLDRKLLEVAENLFQARVTGIVAR